MKNHLQLILVAFVPLLAFPAQTRAALGTAEYRGMCDASAAVAVGPTMFVVANDEDNVLRVYQSSESGEPTTTFPLDSFLQIDAENPEADIEGATRVVDRVYWISSHGKNKNGKPRPNRLRFFATDATVANGKASLTPVGQPYKNLLQDLLEDPGLKELHLEVAAKKAPEDPDGLNIEGLAATPEGALLIAFRNPIPGGKALLVPLENPKEVVLDGKAAKLGPPIQIPLGGSGIRSIEYFEAEKKYLIVAGPPGDIGDFKLYRWSGSPTESPELIKALVLEGLRPEAFILYPGEKTRIQVLSDDGAVQVDGKECKDAKPEKRSFRSFWVAL
jgi:hypothetical protein